MTRWDIASDTEIVTSFSEIMKHCFVPLSPLKTESHEISATHCA